MGPAFSHSVEDIKFMTLYSMKGGTSQPYVYIFLETINTTVYTFFSESAYMNVTANSCSWKENQSPSFTVLSFSLKHAVLWNMPPPMAVWVEGRISEFAVCVLITHWLKTHSCSLQVTWRSLASSTILCGFWESSILQHGIAFLCFPFQILSVLIYIIVSFKVFTSFHLTS